MWLAKQQKRPAEEAPGEVGVVTLGGDTPAVELDSERRNLAVYAPGGYRWRPAPGQKVLVLKAGGEPCIAGTPSQGGLEPGEVELKSAAGSGLKLDGQGGATLNSSAGAVIKLDSQGNVAVTGRLSVGGTELTALVRSIAAQVAASMIGG